MNTGTRGWAFALSVVGLLAVCLALGWVPALQQNAGWKIAGYGVLLPLGLGVVLLWPRFKAGRSTWGWLLGLALVTRLALLAHPAGDDINRYLWEGKLVRVGESPYAHVADAGEWAAWRDDYWRGMNHRDVHTIYPPVTQWIFAAAGAVWYDPLALKLLFIAFDLGTIALIAALLECRRLPVRFAGLYAFNPVSLMGIAAEGHFDALLIFAVVAVLGLLETRRLTWAWVALALAVQIKLVAVLLVPLLLRHGGWRRAGGGLLVVVAPWLVYAADLPAWLTGMRTFGGGMAFNGFVHALLVPLTGQREITSLLCAGLLATWTLLVAWRQADAVRAAFWILGGLIVLSPTVHYWYLAWLLVLLPFCPSPAWLVLSGSMGLYFLAWASAMAGGPWMLPRWGQLAIWTPFALLLLREAPTGVRWLIRGRRTSLQRTVGTLAVVVPTLNESGNLSRCLESIRAMVPAPDEVIVADGGSDDDTLAIARRAGVKIVSAPRGRGRQIAAGVAGATADAVLVLHADSLVQPDAGSRIIAALNANQDAEGGAVGQRFDTESAPLLVVEVLNEIRALFFGSSFGDQGQFFRREQLAARGGFPGLPLMEDVEFSLRLRAMRPPLYLGGGLVCSARRWQRDGWLRRVWMVLALTTEFHLRRGNRDACAEALYRKYYPAKPTPPEFTPVVPPHP